MLILKSNVPSQFTIDYDVVDQDSKTAGDISTAKFFLSLGRSLEPESKYFIKTYGSGLTYSSGAWTVTVEQGDLDSLWMGNDLFIPVLAIKYTGESYFREPILLEGSVPLRVRIDRHYTTNQN